MLLNPDTVISCYPHVRGSWLTARLRDYVPRESKASGFGLSPMLTDLSEEKLERLWNASDGWYERWLRAECWRREAENLQMRSRWRAAHAAG